jgi:uncharacterized phage protein (TIGR01671 family)
MSRKTKFRVWDKPAKKMIYPDDGYQGHYVLDLNGRFHNLQNGSGGDECVVQQFTGLKDKNGKDIYEGDIVSQDAPHDLEWVGIVGFDDKELAAFRVDISNHMRNLASYLQITKYWEVIGNVFENPELV